MQFCNPLELSSCEYSQSNQQPLNMYINISRIRQHSILVDVSFRFLLVK